MTTNPIQKHRQTHTFDVGGSISVTGYFSYMFYKKYHLLFECIEIDQTYKKRFIVLYQICQKTTKVLIIEKLHFYTCVRLKSKLIR